MKIAMVSDDGVTISEHFGRAAYYVIVTVENNQIVAREQRAKSGHTQFDGETHAEGADPRGHGYGPAEQSRHARMASEIADCQILLTRGMGSGAYDSMQAAGIRPIVTDIPKIDDAVKAHLSGTLVNHSEWLH